MGYGVEELGDIPLYDPLGELVFGLFGFGSLIDVGYWWGADVGQLPWEE